MGPFTIVMNAVTDTGKHTEGFERLGPVRQTKTGKGPVEDIGVRPASAILHA